MPDKSSIGTRTLLRWIKQVYPNQQLASDRDKGLSVPIRQSALELGVGELDTISRSLGQKDTEDIRGALAQPLRTTIARVWSERDFTHASSPLSNEAVIRAVNQVPLR